MPVKTVFFDIDYTLTEFSHEDGITALHEQLVDSGVQDDDAEFMAAYVDRSFHAVLGVGKSSISRQLRQFVEEIAARARAVEGWVQGANLEWSRELWIQEAAKQIGVPLPSSRIVSLADAYWRGIKEGTIMYDEVPELLRRLVRGGWRIILVTSSDGRLYAPSEDSLAYDPERATEAKMERLHPYLLQYASLVVVGDPVGKPHEKFWQRVFKETGFLAHEQPLGVMVGDSYRSDIRGMRQWGIYGVLLDRSATLTNLECPTADLIISNLRELQTYLDELQVRG